MYAYCVIRSPYSVLRFNQVYGKLVKVFSCVRIAYTVQIAPRSDLYTVYGKRRMKNSISWRHQRVASFQGPRFGRRVDCLGS